jgi:uncharacterized protein with PIN domain
MPLAEFRFYEELNDYLPPQRRKRSFVHGFDGTPSVKDVIEGLGVPHTEIDLILVNGRSARFAHRLRGGERVAVYPMIERFELRPLYRLRPKPLRRTRFLADVHLGKLARLLRLLGFDTRYSIDLSDRELVATSIRERRILLSRDVRLFMYKALTRGYRLRSTVPEHQLEEVIEALSLRRAFQPFTRCMSCNHKLHGIPRATVKDRIPSPVFKRFRRFAQCPGCERIYWRGTHFLRLEQIVRRLRTAPLNFSRRLRPSARQSNRFH